MAAGWIKLHRKLLDNTVMRNPVLLQVWVWCLLKARHQDCETLGRGIVRAGSFETGRYAAAEELNISASRWMRAIGKLSKANYIATKSDSKKTTVTICNWKTYQSDDDSIRTASGQPADSQRTASGQPADTNTRMEEGKKEAPLPPSNGNQNGDDIGWLVREWFHVYSGGRKADLHKEVGDGMRELLRLGWTVDNITAAIKDGNRLRTEWPSTFFARLGKSGKQAPPTPKVNHATRRQLADMERQKAPDAREVSDTIRQIQKRLRIHTEPEAPES